MAFNPLDKVNLGRSVEQALLDRPCEPLPPVTPFEGAGIYAIYYSGAFPAYEPLSRPECEAPIYVGKAVPPGARKGRVGLGAPPGRVLFNRLRQHANSIAAVQRYAREGGVAESLELADFRCRYVIVEDIWIPLGEALLIAHFKPLWNQVVDGFGSHEPGKRRYGGERSEWDELHPGRAWYREMVPAGTAEDVLSKIETHLAARPPVTVPPPTGTDTDTEAALAVELPEDKEDPAV